MSSSVLSVHPWKSSDSIGAMPPSVTFVCSYTLNLGPADVEETVYLERSAVDVLWLITFNDVWRGARCEPQETPLQSVCVLLDALIESRVGAAWPAHFMSAGLLNEDGFRETVRTVEVRLNNRIKAAEALANAAIVKAARALGLNPSASAKSTANWQANCPQTNHWIMLTPASNEWGCGWCKRRGGPPELANFVQERRVRDASDRG